MWLTARRQKMMYTCYDFPQKRAARVAVLGMVMVGVKERRERRERKGAQGGKR
jgi:hypothetical protein